MTLKERAVKETNEYLEKQNIAAEIENVGEEFVMGCEWCDNKSKAVLIEFTPTSCKQFDKGFCCTGAGLFFEDKSFRCQGEWHVCGRCPES